MEKQRFVESLHTIHNSQGEDNPEEDEKDEKDDGPTKGGDDEDGDGDGSGKEDSGEEIVMATIFDWNFKRRLLLFYILNVYNIIYNLYYNILIILT